MRIKIMKRQIFISLFVVFCITCFAGAFDLSGSNPLSFSGEDQTAYKDGELIVRFADPAPGTQPASGPTLIGPLSRHGIRNAISNYIMAGAEVDREYDNVSPGLTVVRLPEGQTVLDAFIKCVFAFSRAIEELLPYVNMGKTLCMYAQ